jgi:hypothetical protein
MFLEFISKKRAANHGRACCCCCSNKATCKAFTYEFLSFTLILFSIYIYIYGTSSWTYYSIQQSKKQGPYLNRLVLIDHVLFNYDIYLCISSNVVLYDKKKKKKKIKKKKYCIYNRWEVAGFRTVIKRFKEPRACMQK